jgi:predicted AAA+ superfamily ATPase
MRRDITEKLANWKDSETRKPLILRGARQIGKTHSLIEFGRKFFPNYHYVNFESNKKIHKAFDGNLEPKEIIDLMTVALNREIGITDLLIFDEIQEKPEAITSLKYFAEKMPGQAICAAGSLLGLKFNEYSFPVGKVDFLDMFPMSFLEFVDACGNDKLLKYINAETIDSIPDLVHEKLWDELKKYFIIGGLPAAVNGYIQFKDSSQKAFAEVRKIQDQIISTYMEDMTKHSGKANSMHIERLWSNIPSQLGDSIDGAAEKFIFKDIIPGIKAYSRLVNVIDWLEATGLIIKVKIVNKATKPLISQIKENQFKLFIFDIGILTAMSELKAKDILDYDFGNYKGYYAENFVAQEFRRIKGIKNNLYAWDEGDAEIEFLEQNETGIIPIEVKSGHLTRAKSLDSFINRYHPPKAIVLSAKNLKKDLDKNKYFYPIYLAASARS